MAPHTNKGTALQHSNLCHLSQSRAVKLHISSSSSSPSSSSSLPSYRSSASSFSSPMSAYSSVVIIIITIILAKMIFLFALAKFSRAASSAYRLLRYSRVCLSAGPPATRRMRKVTKDHREFHWQVPVKQRARTSWIRTSLSCAKPRDATCDAAQ